jgi:hypothetical protein
MLLLSSLGLFGTLFSVGRSKVASTAGKKMMLLAILVLLATGMTFTVACGNYSNHTPSSNQASLTITGTSGGLSHSVPVSVTVR